jgi:hypothetical protein
MMAAAFKAECLSFDFFSSFFLGYSIRKLEEKKAHAELMFLCNSTNGNICAFL